ncbi:hypothetical protein DUI87_03657 [Hirundo rustica rustica]|uniref:Reverse transcriptase domain-containing protein n=1 Tax=Hirundo rustica rustica TaxID=333673 RepID=A0A3M0L137_HIRRU|nr:hypothetical protein DUI87_03657 [Hirundo rustica rustica]
MDDVLMCAPNDDLLSHVLDLTIDSLVATGFELQEKKIQKMPPWKNWVWRLVHDMTIGWLLYDRYTTLSVINSKTYHLDDQDPNFHHVAFKESKVLVFRLYPDQVSIPGQERGKFSSVWDRLYKTPPPSELFIVKDSGTLEEVAQRDGRCPIAGNTQGPVGRGSEQPDLVPVHDSCVGLDNL